MARDHCRGYHHEDEDEEGRKVIERERTASILTSVLMGLLTGPHLVSMLANHISTIIPAQEKTYQTFFSDEGSWTIRLSEGERPVFLPE